MNNPTVVFFDGVCNLCNGFINYLMKLDSRDRLRFGSLQGEAAHELLGAEADALASLVVVRDGEVYRESEALLQIGLALGGIHALGARTARVLPRGLRDFIYRSIARNRYSLFGKRDTCRMPTAEERGRFLS